LPRNGGEQGKARRGFDVFWNMEEFPSIQTLQL